MNQGKPMRVVSVDGEVVDVRPLSLSERLSYYFGYAVGALARGIRILAWPTRRPNSSASSPISAPPPGGTGTTKPSGGQ